MQQQQNKGIVVLTIWQANNNNNNNFVYCVLNNNSTAIFLRNDISRRCVFVYTKKKTTKHIEKYSRLGLSCCQDQGEQRRLAPLTAE